MKKIGILLFLISFSYCLSMQMTFEDIIDAIQHDRMIVKAIIDKIDNIHTIKDEDGRTLVHWAAFYGRVILLKWLIEMGAPLNELDSDGYAPIHFAAWMGHNKIIDILLENGADQTVESPLGTYESILKSPF